MRKYKEIKEALWAHREALSGDYVDKNTQEILGWIEPAKVSVALARKQCRRTPITIENDTNEIHLFVNFGSRNSYKYQDVYGRGNNFVVYFQTDGKIVTEIQLDQADTTEFMNGNYHLIDWTKYEGYPELPPTP